MNEGFVDHVASRYEGLVVEVGVGERPGTAERLDSEPHIDVVATDVTPRDVDGPRFVEDDVTDPDLAVYRDATLLYGLRAPPELHRPIAATAAAVDADALVVPFGNDAAPVPHELRSVAGTAVLELATDAVDGD